MRARAVSYAAPSSSHTPSALRNAASAARASPSASASVAVGVTGQCSQDVVALAPCNLVELGAGAPSLLELTAGDHDLDVGGQQLRSLQRVRPLRLRPDGCRSRILGLALGQANECQAGLRLMAGSARRSKVLLSRAELAAKAVDLTGAVERSPARTLV